jgi:hypothetical protein
MEAKNEEMSKFIKNKFEFLQEKQFTVPSLVGTGKKFKFQYLGEYLED